MYNRIFTNSPVYYHTLPSEMMIKALNGKKRERSLEDLWADRVRRAKESGRNREGNSRAEGRDPQSLTLKVKIL